MSGAQTGVRITPARDGAADVATGIPVLDHLVGELARSGRFRVTLEVAPESADEAVAAAGRAFGQALAARLDSPEVAGRGWAFAPEDEALAAVVLERTDPPLLASNVDFTDERVGGLGTDVASRFLREVVEAAHLNLHVRLLEGKDPQHVLTAIFKALGASLGQACRPDPALSEEEGS